MNNNLGTVIATSVLTTIVVGSIGGAYFLGKRQAPQILQPAIQPTLTATPKPASQPTVSSKPVQVPDEVRPSQKPINSAPAPKEKNVEKEDLPSCDVALWGNCDPNKQSVSSPSPKKEVEKPKQEIPSCEVALFGNCNN